LPGEPLLTTRDRKEFLCRCILFFTELISTIFVLEYPNKGWSDLLDILANNSTFEDRNIQRSAFMTLGYICEKLSASNLEMGEAEVQAIIGGIGKGLVEEQRCDENKLTALKALQDALPLFSWKLAEENVRDFLLNIVVQNSNNSNKEIALRSVQALIDLCKKCYPYLSNRYMDVIVDRTLVLMKSNYSSIVVATTEFWNTIAIHEAKLLRKKEFDSRGVVYHGFILNYSKMITQALLTNLLKKEVEDIESGLSVHGATFACLTHINSVGFANNKELSIDFITSAMANSTDDSKIAGLLCFEAMIAGCVEDISELIVRSFEAIMSFLKVNAQLCKASLKVIKEISYKYPDILLEDQLCVEWLELLFKLLQGDFELGVIVAEIFSALGNACFEAGRNSGYFVGKLDSLIQMIIELTFAKEASTRIPYISACFGAVMNMIKAIKSVPKLVENLAVITKALSSTNTITGEHKLAVKEGLFLSALSTLYTLKRLKVQRSQLNDQVLASLYQLCAQECNARSAVFSDALHSLIALACRNV